MWLETGNGYQSHIPGRPWQSGHFCKNHNTYPRPRAPRHAKGHMAGVFILLLYFAKEDKEAKECGSGSHFQHTGQFILLGSAKEILRASVPKSSFTVPP